jgi:hypothetical protein
MFPSPLIDYGVWTILDEHQDTGLILLHGHQLLEMMLSIGLINRLSFTESKIKKLSFCKKLEAFAILGESHKPLAEALKYLKQLNRLRNTFAHEPFSEVDTALAAWSIQVLKVFLVYKHQRFTRRTKVTHAIAAIARVVYEFGHCEADRLAQPRLLRANNADN